MPIKTLIFEYYNLSIHLANGEIGSQNIMDTVRTYYEGPQTKNILWDLSNATSNSISEIDIHRLMSFLGNIKMDRPGGKTAIIPNSHITPNFLASVKMYHKYFRDDLPFKTFDNMIDALKWLNIAEESWEKIQQAITVPE